MVCVVCVTSRGEDSAATPDTKDVMLKANGFVHFWDSLVIGLCFAAKGGRSGRRMPIRTGQHFTVHHPESAPAGKCSQSAQVGEPSQPPSWLPVLLEVACSQPRWAPARWFDATDQATVG